MTALWVLLPAVVLFFLAPRLLVLVARQFKGKGWEQRRGLPIAAYVGANGGGKTLAMIHDTLPTLAGMPWRCENPTHHHTASGVTEGMRTVLSTVKVLGAEGQPHPFYRELRSWRELVRAEHCDVLLDEVTGAASSRSYQALPPQLVQLFLQLRKADVVMRYTTPNWARTDVVLREVTQAVTVCKGFFWERSGESLWPAKRFFRWATYDAMDWEELSMEKVAKTRPLMVAWYWRPTGAAMHAYNTKDAVTVLDHVSESGQCLECGGARSRPKCGCVREEKIPASEVVIAGAVLIDQGQSRREAPKGPEPAWAGDSRPGVADLNGDFFRAALGLRGASEGEWGPGGPQ